MGRWKVGVRFRRSDDLESRHYQRLVEKMFSILLKCPPAAGQSRINRKRDDLDWRDSNQIKSYRNRLATERQ